VHFLTSGRALLHSYFGMPNGQAIMQKRQPMQRSALYTTGPSGVLINALTGQTVTVEALVAAIYLDSGFNAARRFVERQVAKALSSGSIATADQNYKSRLLEYAQSHGFGVPRYLIVQEEGPDHDRTFTIDVFLHNERRGTGTGKNKKEAEQAAASEALAQLGL